MRVFYFSLILILLSSRIVDGQVGVDRTDIVAGHSYHGEAFNEGPRQKPYLMPGLGRSEFQISTQIDTAQSFFNQGIDQLHGFWYFEAERSFRQVVLLDPDCAMAYWGLAMANVNNEDRAQEFLEQAQEKMKAADREISDRETLFVQALATYYDDSIESKKQRAANFVGKLEELVLKFPDDIEAKAFLACQVWMNQRQGIEITSYVGINSILDDIFDVDPDHPAHHYRIHLWDYENAEVALQSAAKCGPSLPNIAHMWHMPGHIFSRLNRYEDAVWQQEASARVDHRHMMRDWVLPDQIHNFAHNNEWCVRNLIHVGRIRDAVELATNMISLPQHPKYNTPEKSGSSSQFGKQRLFQTFTTFEMWDELIDACNSSLLAPSGINLQDTKRLRFLGRAYYRSNKLENGRAILSILQNRLSLAKSAKQIAESEARVEQIRLTRRYRELSKTFASWFPVSLHKFAQDNIFRANRRDHRSRVTTAVADATKELENEINVIKRSIDELEGHQLVCNQKYKEAVKKFEKAGQVDAVYRAYISHLAGETDKAIKQAREFVESHKNEVQPLIMLTWLLWETEKQEAASETLSELLEISASIDFESLFFDRLDPILESAGIQGDWRNSPEKTEGISERPELDSLGPFRWQPVDAPEWTLLDSAEKAISMSDYSGRPVVIIFYLGHGCLHCAEQLQKFAPKTHEFYDAGIEVLAISSDDRDGLAKSIASYGDAPLPITLLADPQLEVFRQFRCFDEFENQPLHGTFLIDAGGKVRWQDVSYEPFMDPGFLLEESSRLLSNQSVH